MAAPFAFTVHAGSVEEAALALFNIPELLLNNGSKPVSPPSFDSLVDGFVDRLADRRCLVAVAFASPQVLEGRTPEFVYPASSGSAAVPDASVALDEFVVPVGFKVGYELFPHKAFPDESSTSDSSSGVFYSWLGGVAPSFRGLGVASSLLRFQERWASGQGFSCLRVKSRNCYPSMLAVLIGSGYSIVGFDPGPDPSDVDAAKILFEKSL